MSTRTNAVNDVRLTTATGETTGATGLTFTFDSTADGPAVPCYAVVAYDDNAKKEYVRFTVKTGTTYQCGSLDDRYLAGSAAESGIEHGEGTTVDFVVAAQTLDDLWTAIEANESSLDGKAADDAVVKLTGAQTVAGVKTFSSSPIVPTPTTDMQASTKKYVDDAIGSATSALGDLSDVTTAGGSEGDVLTQQGDGSFAIAAPPAGAPVVAGTYTGDGASDRLIPLDFDPVYVRISFNNRQYFSDLGGATPGIKVVGTTWSNGSDRSTRPELSTGGFIVTGSSQGPNEDTALYHYVAWGAS